MIRPDWDTPPDGDFVRYLERLTAPAPGAVLRGKAAAAARAASVQTMVRTAPAATRASNAPRGAHAAHPTHASSTPAPQRVQPVGPPDLSTIFRQLFSQLGDEMKKAAQNRR